MASAFDGQARPVSEAIERVDRAIAAYPLARRPRALRALLEGVRQARGGDAVIRLEAR